MFQGEQSKEILMAKEEIDMKRSIIAVWVSMMIIVFAVGVGEAMAQSFPDRPIHVIVANVAGSIMDINARTVSEELAKILGTQIVVVDKPGAGTTLGSAEVARAKKDGYTVGYLSAGGLVYQRVAHAETIPYDSDKDLEPLGIHVFVPLTVAVRADSPWKTFAELIDYAKKNPGKLRVSTSGVGATDHFNLEIIQSIADVEFTHVPFKGGESVITALLGGHVEVCFDAYGKIKPHVDAGKLRFLLTSKKIPENPQIPTATELGYNQGTRSTWFGFFAPAGIPEEAREKLVSALEKVITSPEIKAKAANMGFIDDFKPPLEARKIMKEDFETASAIARKIGLNK